MCVRERAMQEVSVHGQRVTVIADVSRNHYTVVKLRIVCVLVALPSQVE